RSSLSCPSRSRHTRSKRDCSSDVCSFDLHMESVFLLRRPAVVQILPDHLTVIAHPVDKGIQFRDPHTGLRLVFKKGYVRLPCKSLVERILLYIIMVPRHQEYPGFRYGGKEIIHFFQFSQEGLSVKKISGYN